MENETPAAAAAKPKRFSIVRRLLLIVLAILPGLYALLLVEKHGVNVPYADEFTLAPMLVKAHAGAISFQDLFAQHNEHRVVLPNLLYLAFARCARGDLHAEMVFSVILSACSALGLWWLLRRTTSSSPSKTLFLSLLINLLLFSPVQAENWCWGFQLCVFLTDLLLIAAIVVASSSLSLPVIFGLTSLLAIGATFSFGNGLLLWPLSFPLILLRQDLAKIRKATWLTAWTLLALSSVGAYFIGYIKPAAHPSFGASSSPLDYYLYVATFLGAHLSRANNLEPILLPALIGTTLLALYFAALALVVERRNDSLLVQSTAPWFALGGYALLSAILAAVARIGFGVSQALDSRYTSFSLYLTIAVIGLAAIIGKELRANPLRFQVGEYLPRVEVALVNAFLILSLTAYSWGAGAMSEIERNRLRGKAALLLANVVDCGPVYEGALIANAHDARMFANMLDGIGLLRPAMLKSAQVSNLTRYSADKFYAGYIDQVMHSGDRCEVKGWAFLPKLSRLTDCVVLSNDAPGTEASLFRVADEAEDRPDVARLLRNAALTHCGWRAHFDRSTLPAGEQRISAWALDAKRALFFQLRDSQTLP